MATYLTVSRTFTQDKKLSDPKSMLLRLRKLAAMPVRIIKHVKHQPQDETQNRHLMKPIVTIKADLTTSKRKSNLNWLKRRTTISSWHIWKLWRGEASPVFRGSVILSETQVF